MTKPVIVTRLGKGSELTFQEGDDNFTNLQNATVSVSGDSGTPQSIELNGSIAIAGGTGVSTAITEGTVTINGFSGSYADLSSKPTLFSGSYTDLADKPTLFSGVYADLTSKPSIPTNNNELTNGAGYITGIDSSAVTTALGFTPENSANKNQNSGYAGLDTYGLIPSSLLPSYVDDVIEAANFAALPVTGDSGKIYVTIDTAKTYRWGGSAYVEISASPGSTDSVTEGSTNLYFTTSRARDAFSAGTSISITDGVIAVSGSLGMSDIVEDTSPQLGGDLDVNGNSIVSASDGNITLAPNGTGNTVIESNLVLDQSGSSTMLVKTGTGQGLVIVTNGDVETGSISIDPGTEGDAYVNSQRDIYLSTNIESSNASGNIFLNSLKFPSSDGTADQVLTTDGSGNLGWATASGGISDIVEDTTPQLGGALDVNGNAIISTSNGNIALSPDGSGKVVIDGYEFPDPQPVVVSGTVTATNSGTSTVTLSVSSGMLMMVMSGYGIKFFGSGVSSIGLSANTNYSINSVDSGNNTVTLMMAMGMNTVGSVSDVTFEIYAAASTKYLTFNGSVLDWTSITTPTLGSLGDVSVMMISDGQVLTYNSTSSRWVNQSLPAAGIANVVEDTTPQLGGNLDGQGNTISNVNLKDYKETNYALSYASTITPNAVNGNVQTITLTGNVTFSAFASPEAGQSITLIVKQDATGSRTLTSTMKFAGGTKTLTTAANSVDIISVFYDGTTYWASLSTDFK